jgi:hypothetical protein
MPKMLVNSNAAHYDIKEIVSAASHHGFFFLSNYFTFCHREFSCCGALVLVMVGLERESNCSFKAARHIGKSDSS